MNQKIIAVIPARYAATRFPAKLMQPLGAKPVIAHTYDAAVASSLFDAVYVVTDSPIIFDEITQRGGLALMSSTDHESGTDRIAEAVRSLEVDIVINIQGDEPFIEKEPLEKLVALFDSPRVQVGSLMRPFDSPEDASNPNMVKLVTSKSGRALYFSRSRIPFDRDGMDPAHYFLHVGVYGFRKSALMQFTQWPAGKLEQIEKLEQLRFLENDVDLYMAQTSYRTLAIDTPEDLERAARHLNQN